MAGGSPWSITGSSVAGCSPGATPRPRDGGALLATALREAREETGCPVAPHPHAPRPLDVDVHSIPSRGADRAHLHLDVRFLVVTDRPEALRASTPRARRSAGSLSMRRSTG